MVRFDLWPVLQGQTRVATRKCVYNSFIIAHIYLGCEANPQKVMGTESSDMVRFDLGPPFKVKQGYTNSIVPISPLVLLLGVLN